MLPKIVLNLIQLGRRDVMPEKHKTKILNFIFAFFSKCTFQIKYADMDDFFANKS